MVQSLPKVKFITQHSLYYLTFNLLLYLISVFKWRVQTTPRWSGIRAAIDISVGEIRAYVCRFSTGLGLKLFVKNSRKKAHSRQEKAARKVSNQSNVVLGSWKRADVSVFLA